MDELTLEQRYQKWLIDKFVNHDGKTYNRLLARLFIKEFYATMARDDSRGKDGIMIRSSWHQEYYDRDSISMEYCRQNFGICKIIEVLYGLVLRIQNELYASTWGERLTENDIFWVLATNLGLDDFDDKETKRNRIEEINDILIVWLDRKYKRNGAGGVFPLKNADTDQRKSELWVQMGLYVRENWPI